MPVVVAPLIMIAVALLALLLYYGADWLGRAIVHFTPDIHLPGLGSLRGLVSSVVDTGVFAIQHIMYPVVHPVVQLLDGIATWMARIIGGAVAVGHATAIAIHRMLTIVIPARLAAVRDYARHLAAATLADAVSRIRGLRNATLGWIHDARAYAAALAAGVLADVVDRIHGLRNAVLGWLDDLRAWVVQLVAHTAAVLGHEITQLRAWTAQRILGVEADLHAAVRAVEADIVAAEAAAVHSVEVTLVRPLEGVWEGLGDDVAALEGVLATDFPDIGALLRELDLSKLIDLLGVAGLSTVMARVLARYLRECGVPTCRNTAGWARGIFEVLEAIGDASLLALFTEMILHPESTAHTVDNLLGSIARPFVGEVKQLIGV